ncbi:MAG: selenocysteine-specific translation elongation factor [Actinomycetota bacterium]
MRTVATAGHVDHGKSTLVQALTGTDPDRFPEEKARGLTIDLGYAFCTLPSGRTVGFVDVPGHVRFVKNMLAGVGAVDLALLVVAANEGWMPQTEEHVQILDLLGIDHGIVALTKTAITDPELALLTRLEIEERLDWPVIPVDSPTGAGLDELGAALDALLAGAPAPRDDDRPRLWVDRVFAARGSGTVVTGTLTGGSLARDEEVAVAPGDRRARIRGIESRGERLDAVGPGARVALNLAGIDHHELHRGDAVVRPGQWAEVTVVDVALRLLPGREPPRRTEVTVHVGSGEQRARLRLLDDEGTSARVRFDRPVVLAPGDRIVLRSTGARATVGGATVLDLAPARRTADALTRLARPLGARVLAARPWCRPDEFTRLAGRPPGDDDGEPVGEWIVAPTELARVRARATELARDGWPPITTLAADCGVEVGQLRAALGDALPAATTATTDDPAARALVEALGAEPFAPPAPRDLGADPALVRALTRAGVLVEAGGVCFTAAAVEAAVQRIAEAVTARGELSVADARDLLGTSRKYVLPLLERADRAGVTRRRGESRVPGPRAAERR